MPQTVKPMETKLNIDYGHNDNQVVLQFSQPIDRLFMTVAQADAMIDSIEKMKMRLAEHRTLTFGKKTLDS